MNLVIPNVFLVIASVCLIIITLTILTVGGLLVAVLLKLRKMAWQAKLRYQLVNRFLRNIIR